MDETTTDDYREMEMAEMADDERWHALHERDEVIERLRGALLEERAIVLCGAAGDVDDWRASCSDEDKARFRARARAELIAEGLLPPE